MDTEEKNIDKPLEYHISFRELLDAFRNTIAANTWLKVSVTGAKKYFEKYPYVITLPCSTIWGQEVKIDKTIFNLIEREGFNEKTPIFTETLVNFYRIITIAIKDIIWEEPDFQNILSLPELQFLRHIRNASAHNNSFFWGKGKQHQDTINKLPVSWRNKTIEEKLEGDTLYMNFMAPGDLFILLSDITDLFKKYNP